MNWTETLRYLDGFVDYERAVPGQTGRKEFSLERIAALAARLGHPERRFHSVHIAGTKGKGSTAAFCESIALAAGLPTGLYTSPHLVELRERIRIGGRMAPRALLAAEIERVRPVLDEVRAAPGDRRLTYFEVLTHLAFQAFAARGVKLAVVEVGMGGRLDATNIVTPLVSVITSISLDHTAQLGGTLAAIAGEKAGICKPGVPAVVAGQPAEAMAAISARAAAAGAGPLLAAGRDFTALPGRRRAGHWREMDLSTPGRTYRELRVRMLGAVQLENAALAVVAMEQAAARGGFELPEEAVRAGLERARWPGRLQVARRAPVPVLLDGAHNPDSMAKLVRAVAEEFPARRPWAAVFAAAADKDVGGMLGELAPRCALLVATDSGNPRRLDPRAVAALAANCGAARTAVEGDFGRALAAARAAAGPGGLVLVTGSLYLVGRARRHLKAARVAVS